MEQMLPVAAADLLGALCAVVLRREAGELALLLGITTSLIVLTLVASGCGELLALLEQLAETADISDALLGALLKILGIEVLTNLAGHICRDAGESGIAAAVELSGAVCALYTAIPVIQAVLILIEELV